MKKIFGILGLFIVVFAVTTLVSPEFVTPDNLYNLMRWTGLFGIIGIGVSLVIITGGIDLSIGSVVGLTGCLLAMLLAVSYTPETEPRPVHSVDPAQRQLVLPGPKISLAPGDRLEYAVDSQRTRQLTVAAVRQSDDGGLVVTVRETPRDPGLPTAVTISRARHMSVLVAAGLVLAISAGIGLLHGLLITRLRLQPFVVTLCGLLFYRGAARWLTGDRVQGFGTGFERLEALRYLANGRPFSVPVPFLQWIYKGGWSATATDAAGHSVALPVIDWVPIPMPVLILALIAAATGLFLHRSIYGRYLLALGRNEQAARYSGIRTDRMVVLAYVLCSLLAGVAGILFALDLNSIQPGSHGDFYELYAIAAAVLGGCSLRGGEGTMLGVVIGAAVLRLLRNSITLMGIDPKLEFAVIGLVILIAVIVDELVKRLAARRRARHEAALAEKGA